MVHEDHGIARFAGIETRTVADVTRDYLLLEFRGDDRVFVPHDQIGKVSRYIGASGATPSLDKLGGTHWQTVKTRARTSVVEMAGELLQLYAARQAIPGFAYPPDGELMRRLEEAFPFEETDDQAEAIDEVKNDMEAPHPMDRLICGDVGYGKTEVALRAAFKAAEAGKQTLVLVPTTILAEQHWMTFEERFADLPVKVGMVSRFRSGAEQRKTLAQFSGGQIDVLVGTHRLLSTDVRPKELGLVIVDEEQRFGVRQKEVLRSLKLQVDVMSLSATPIPRTLQMTLSRHPRHLRHRDARRAAATRSAPTSASTGTTSCASPSRRSWRAGARCTTCTTAWRPSTRRRSTCARSCPRRACSSRTGRWRSGSSRRSCSRSSPARPTCW